MNRENSLRRWIACLVLISFLGIAAGEVAAAPLMARNADKADKPIERNEDAGSGVVEKAEDTPAVGVKKKFPWLLVAAGTVVAGVAVYFIFFHKPKYELTVEVGTGVTGTPAPGTYKHKKGSMVPYSFAAAAGYKNVTVTLDGRTVNLSGTVTMDKAHKLSVSAVELAKYTLTVELDEGVSGTPANGTYQYTEGTEIKYVYSLKTGFCNLRVRVQAPGGNNHLAAQVTEYGSFVIFNNSKITVTSDPEIETGFDIRGKWRINSSDGESIVLFTGTPYGGEFQVLSGAYLGAWEGTYKVTFQNVSFTFWFSKQYLLFYTFNGIMQTNDQMGGESWYWSDPLTFPNGSWTGTRIE